MRPRGPASAQGSASAEDGTRLNKFISESGLCSRREADKLIEQRRVRVNGRVAEIGTRVGPSDQVEVDRKVIQAADKEKPIFVAFHKPVGIECVTDPTVRNNIIDAVRHPRRIFPIGRLDVPSEGLIFLTNDGDSVNKILRAGNAHEKEYEVTVDQPISDEFIERMGNGIPILGTVTKKCRVEKVSPLVFRIVLVEGLNRQIRRMCEHLGYEVTRLKRTRIMSITLEGLGSGDWRELDEREVAEIQRLVEGSSKTEEASRKSTGPSGPRRPAKSRDRFKPRRSRGR
ncbi:MAG: 23S rRNA pseudouridine(2604) synthase RluF [Deltaproteobacteria bacterium]|nr:23S rRNA pseudouridine(2604) synthase RluF [Deltaproteobacteria bacterium]